MVNTTTSAFLYRLTSETAAGSDVWPIGDKPLVVGRGESADACIDDLSLSRSHFLVVREGGAHFVIDLNSSNGTTVEGRKITAHKLRNHDIILAGGSLFCFCIGPEPPPAIPAHLLSGRTGTDAPASAIAASKQK